jgi:hypothetical protein
MHTMYQSAGSDGVGPWGGPLLPPVLFDRSATTRTARLTVIFRVILAVPHLVIVEILGIAELAVMVVSWFAALFTARVPPGMYGFMAWVAAYQARVAAYLLLLTDKWPTFSETDPYPVAIRFPGPERLNRWAVGFRLILLVPAGLMSSLMNTGAALVLVPVGWLIVGIMGRVPAPLFDALARVNRYQLRVQAYFSMLTSAYPAGLYSDEKEPWADPPPLGPYAVEPPRPSSGRGLMILITVLGVIGLIADVATG